MAPRTGDVRMATVGSWDPIAQGGGLLLPPFLCYITLLAKQIYFYNYLLPAPVNRLWEVLAIRHSPDGSQEQGWLVADTSLGG